MSEKVAIVTGGNKGIGYAIVKGLAQKYPGVVYLTSRDQSRGEAAVESLGKLGLSPRFHQLDIDDPESVNKFRDHLKQTHGGIDLIINNAAIAFNVDATEPVSHQAEQTLKTNYFGTARVSDALFPLLRQNAVVVNISSSCGHLSKIPSEELRDRFSSDSLTREELDELMEEFVEDTKDGTYLEKGWGNSTYVVSKVGVSALTRIQQREFDEERPCRNISINSVHPGYVDTDMSNHKGPMTIDEGAVAPLYLALEPHGLKGEYVWKDAKVFNWSAPTPQPKH